MSWRPARHRLIDENQRKLQLERRLLHADKLATIGTLASGFAHEIGTPLGVIRGRAEFLLTSRLDERKVTEGLGIIVNRFQSHRPDGPYAARAWAAAASRFAPRRIFGQS